ncbi:MAG TPA: oxidoreductase [Polyangia bacterium]
MPARRRFKLAVWKFASCDGCQLSLLDLEDELVALGQAVHIAYFLEASSATAPGPYDLSIIDGSVTTAADRARILEVRRRSRVLMPIGACATAGGIQALRNLADVGEYAARVYPRPGLIDALPTSTPMRDHVPVDLELRGCPPNKHQVLDAICAIIAGRVPVAPTCSVCVECKLRLTVCVMVTGTPCLGPVTHAGCGALCPSYARGCYGCFGPMETPNTDSLSRAFLAAGVAPRDLARRYHTFCCNAPAFREAGRRHAR